MCQSEWGIPLTQIELKRESHAEMKPDSRAAADSPGLRGVFRLIAILWLSLPFLLDLKFGSPAPGKRKLRAVRLRRLLVRLGPTFIKIGQALANRPDLVPYEYLKELEQLQDNVPAFANFRARRILKRALAGKKLKPEFVFSTIGKSPIAAASLGQVYEARLWNGDRVAIKIQRPGAEKKIERDVAALRMVAGFAESRKDIGLGINWTDTVNEFAAMIRLELDFDHERRNGERFRENFKGWHEIHVPRFYPEYSDRHVLVMEFVDGMKPASGREIRAQGGDPQKALQIIVKSYLKQLIEDGFFHADPHPGNLRILRDGRVAFFDFGMAGQLEPDKRALFLDLLMVISEKDIEGIVRILADLGFLRTGHEFAEFQPAIEQVFHHYLDRTDRGSIRFHEIVYALSEIVYRYPFTIPTHFTYILRALLTLEGLGMQLFASFSFFKFARPYALEMFFASEAKFMLGQLARRIRGESDYSWDRVKQFSRMFMNYVSNKSLLDWSKITKDDKPALE